MIGLIAAAGKTALSSFSKGGKYIKNQTAQGISNAKKKTISAKTFLKGGGNNPPGGGDGGDGGGGGSSAIILRPRSDLAVKTIKPGSFFDKKIGDEAKNNVETENKKDFEEILNELSLIKSSLLKINESINSNLQSKKDESKKERVRKRKRIAGQRESELEKKKKKSEKGKAGLEKPRMGFFDSILNYFANVFLGSLAVFALSKLPQIIDAFNQIGKNLSNTFNQIRFAIISLTTNFPKQIKSLANLFKKIVTSRPARAIGKLLASAGKAVANIFGKAAKAIFNIIKGPVKNILGKTVSGAIGGAAKGIGSIGKRGLGRAIPRGAAAIGGKNAAAGAARLGLLTGKGLKHFSRIGSLFKRIPFIGALIGIGIDLALGTAPDAAVAGAIGSSLGAAIGGAIGTGLIPIPILGTAAGGFIGSAVGDWAGKEIYKNLKGNITAILPQGDEEPIQKKAEGGTVTTRETAVEKRTIKKVIVDKPIRRPGKPQPVSKQTEDIAKESLFRGDKSLGRFKRLSQTYSDMRFVGTLLKLGIDIGMGETPSRTNIDVAADSLAYSIATAIKNETLELPGVNKNTSGTIANTLSSWARKEVYREIMMKRGELALRETEKDEGVSPSVDGGFEPGSVPGGQLTMEQLVGLAKGAGFSADEAVTMAAIAMAESGGNSNARNFKPPDKSYGLWQINMLGTLGPARMKEFGLTSEDQLFDPVTNAKAAFSVKKSSGFVAWTVYKTGKYKEFLNAAQKAKGAPSLRTSPIATQGPASNVTGGIKPSQIPQTSAQGWRWGKMHKGIDMDGGHNSPISSAQDAVVVSARTDGGYGNTVVLRYSNGAETRFAHLNSMNVREGQSIKAGTLIGRQGNTGRSTASHLHFEYYPRGGAMTYEGYGSAISVKDSYFRYGGDVKPVLTDTPKDKVGSKFIGGYIDKDGNYFLHKGEVVLDKDTTDILGKDNLLALNSIENKTQLKQKADNLIDKIKEYTDSTDSEVTILFPILPKEQPQQIASGGRSMPMMLSGGVNNRITYDTVLQSALYKNG